jgi:hypothetical protein
MVDPQMYADEEQVVVSELAVYLASCTDRKK